MKYHLRHIGTKAFSMIELLIVIAVIGIMAAMVITSFANAAQDTRKVIARQQQAAIQNALNAWVSSHSQANGIANTQIAYNKAARVTNKFDLIKGFLEDGTVESFTVNRNWIASDAMTKTSQRIVLPRWNDDSYPKANLQSTN